MFKDGKSPDKWFDLQKLETFSGATFNAATNSTQEVLDMNST